MRIRSDDCPVELSNGELVTRFHEWGSTGVRFLHIPAGTDLGPILRALPHDRHRRAHWGVVLTGAVNLIYPDGSADTIRAGQVYCWPQGHTGWVDEPSVLVEVGPLETQG